MGPNTGLPNTYEPGQPDFAIRIANIHSNPFLDRILIWDGDDQTGSQGFTLEITEVAAVPVPAGLPLLATAFGAFALLGRRKAHVV